ncbi:hypothetical protein [uncultured Desulfovibrio sp.]|uniref:hypothetical protein n=1 Tax=uncultured Desulfovibrio sp. TaxID=167968 RepID=UPI00345C1075
MLTGGTVQLAAHAKQSQTGSAIGGGNVTLTGSQLTAGATSWSRPCGTCSSRKSGIPAPADCWTEDRPPRAAMRNASPPRPLPSQRAATST